MEIDTDHETRTSKMVTKKGGLRTMPFIIANETLEKVASFGLNANMIQYLKNGYHLSNVTGANVLFIWSAISNFTPIFGAFISDSYLGRFRVIALGTIMTLLGLIVLWLTAIIPGARPHHCTKTNGGMQFCESAKAGQFLFLFSSFILMSIGAGGIRPCSMAFGADQLDNPNNPNNGRILQTFFSWYYASVGISIMISVIAIVAIQDKFGWAVGFGVPVGLMLLSTVLFFLGSSLYIKVKANKSLISSFAQVASAAWKNRHLPLPPRNSDKWYHKGSKLVAPTERLRILNKACIIRNPEDLDSNRLAIDPWNLCTVKQVEELKALIKVLPIWSAGIMIAVTLSQHAFPVLQANTMNRHFIGNVKIPAGSYSVFTLLSLTVWVAIYDRLIVPLLANLKFTNRTQGFSNRQRMGIGLVISCVATAVAGLVEHRRRATAFKQGLEDDPRAVVHMSATWLVLQHSLTGIAEAFNAIGQIEFFYSQFPKTMASIAVSLFSLGMGVGNLVGSVIVAIVDEVTKKDGKVSWVSNNLNRGHYDYYYWLLAGLSVMNFFYYLVCSWAYGSSEDKKIWDDEEEEETREDMEMHQNFGSSSSIRNGNI